MQYPIHLVSINLKIKKNDLHKRRILETESDNECKAI